MTSSKSNSKINVTCPNCGTRLSADEYICPSCGKNTFFTEDEVESFSSSKKDKSDNNISLMVILGLSVVLMIGSLVFYHNQRKASVERECLENDKVFVEDAVECREKTISEKFAEQCMAYGVSVGNGRFSCSDVKEANLESAYLKNALVVHGGKLYEEGTYEEVAAGKKAGDYCLSADDAWYHIGEKRCVVFQYTYLACSKGYCFLDEKKDYNNGFVAFFGKYMMYSWNSFRSTYYNKGPILVCGNIYKYRGHPEIKITNVSRQTLLSPESTLVGPYEVYEYSCS